MNHQHREKKEEVIILTNKTVQELITILDVSQDLFLNVMEVIVGATMRSCLEARIPNKKIHLLSDETRMAIRRTFDQFKSDVDFSNVDFDQIRRVLKEQSTETPSGSTTFHKRMSTLQTILFPEQ